MIFDKLEIIYDKQYIPLKIKYSETRKPTFMEFLLLLILIDYPDKTQILKEALKSFFDVENISLFEKALRDLINYKILDINKNKTGLGILNMDSPIEYFEVNDKIKFNFVKSNYSISNENKSQDIKYYYDPILNVEEILKERTWDKRIKNVKISHKLLVNSNFEKNISQSKINLMIKKFININKDIFGEECLLKEITIDEYNSLEKLNFFNEYIKYDSVAIEIMIEIFENESFKIKSENKEFENYLRNNSNIAKEILIDICNQYEKKLKNKFRPEQKIMKLEKYNSELDLISNINIKTNWNLLLINDQFIESDTEFLKNKELIRNIDIIIFYNSKRNNRSLQNLEGKIVVYFDYIENEILLDNSFIYLDSQNHMSGFLIGIKNLTTINKKIPVVYSYKNPKINLNLIEIFETSINSLLETYKISLKKLDYKKAAEIFTVLERIGLEKEVEEISFSYILDDLEYGEKYNSIKEFLIEEDYKNYLIILERIVTKCIIEISMKKNDDEIFDIISKFNFLNTKNIIKIFNEINISESFENILILNKYLKSLKIDGWRINIRNSLIKLTEYFKNNNRAELFNLDDFNSETWILHASTLNKIGNLTKELYNENYNYVENNFEEFLSSLIDLIKSNVEIEQYDKYLLNISEALIDFYKNFYKYKTKTLSIESQEVVNYKITLMAMNYLSKLEEKTNSLISSKYYNMPIEIKLEWIKHIENKRDEVNEIMNNNDIAYKKALNIIFGKKQNYNSSDIEYYKNFFGGK
ncbi:transcriptional regulator [Spiroplasma taiwanense]|uniref:Uncharacterized protein n=1 Tax=Spiroplasma taiwanense CT-1 TaxID=1276220 RepID=S5LT39_9MOLU|nr:hypothetical protein [Spiroplasma taiwanense]AGR40854.1 hypothetical protein STAIW_v1c01770 [Spiroplasma taiwanense CT-1]